MDAKNKRFLKRRSHASAPSIAPSFRGRCFWAVLIIASLIVSVAHAAKVEDFIPKESFIYAKLQDLDEVYAEIDTSEGWREAEEVLAAERPDFQEAKQGLALLEGMLSTNIASLLSTVTYRTAVAAWLDAAGDPRIGAVFHSGGNLGELQRLTKIVEGFLAMSTGNTLRIDAGVYQRVRYNVLERFDGITKYGFVDDFLVVGIGEGCFERLLDTYRTGTDSIQQNEGYADAVKQLGSGQLVVFADVSTLFENTFGFNSNEPAEDIFGEFQNSIGFFDTLYGRLNLLESGPFLQIATTGDLNRPEAEMYRALTAGKNLEILSALSAKDDLFLAVAPSILEDVWTAVLPMIERDSPEGISFVEGLLNLDLRSDIQSGLTGELALAVSDITRFEPTAMEDLDVQVEGGFQLDASQAETNGCLIFRPDNRMKWNQVGNSLSNLQSASTTQTQYNGVTVSEFGANVYYSDVEELFLIGFSEEQVTTRIDRIKEKRPDYLKMLPETLVSFVQCNLARLFELERGPAPPDKVIVPAEEVPHLLTWIAMDADAGLMEMTFSTEEGTIEVLAKLFPFLLWSTEAQADIEVQGEIGIR